VRGRGGGVHRWGGGVEVRYPGPVLVNPWQVIELRFP
jgi:hypothetical protein